MKKVNKISIPIYEKNNDGTVKPNFIFHRPHNKVHSRCLEYPWAASKYSGEKRILDVGSAKSDGVWLDWLQSLNTEVLYFTDYDAIDKKLLKDAKYLQCDIRRTAFDDNYFDIIFAISVIEHIGLHNPQVNNAALPSVEDDGDIKAFQELIRILKPEGKLIMTIPFGNKFELRLNNEARFYSKNTLRRFSLNNVKLEEIEIYKYSKTQNLPKIYKLFYFIFRVLQFIQLQKTFIVDYPGNIRWEKTFLDTIIDEQKWHTGCVAMGIWKKSNARHVPSK